MFQTKMVGAFTLFASLVWLGTALAGSGPATAETGGEDFGKRIAGTYVITAVQADIPQPYTFLLTLFADGNVSSVQALQFGLGIADFAPFSDQQGVWKKTGKHEITAKIVDLTYNRSDGAPLFNCVATIVMQFDADFQQISGTQNGMCFEPTTVNLLDPGDAKPLREFRVTFKGQRMTVEDDK
jgi:hypothetical protein